MMEGIEHDDTNMEDYIWAMKTSGIRSSDTEMWKERKSDQPHWDNEEELLQKMRRSKVLLPMSKDHTNKILASLVPDEVLSNVNDYTPREIDACLLFGDVSGFTDLSEKYNKTGKSGPSRLTQVLNSYMGQMVQEILSFGGDILKFSGDAFLTIWKTKPNVSMSDNVHKALECSLIIQKRFGTYPTDVGVQLKVKLALSSGRVLFCLIGEKHMSYYMVVGGPVKEVKFAEEMSSSGEIILAPSIVHFLSPNEYLLELLPDKLNVRVKGKGAAWKSTVDETRTSQILHYQIYSDNKESIPLDEEGPPTEDMQNADDFLLRPSVNDAALKDIGQDLRKFIIPPIMRGIDMDEPLEYLTEMRQITIMFVNITTPLTNNNHEYIKLINNCYKIICSVADDMQGCVNKVIAFDKDLMFVILFGLRGYKHELESQTGLRCASECHQMLLKITDIASVSIGVTTGMTYCGVVGHPLRREYTVISLTVNKAARLMCAYKNKVTCDRETFLHSKMAVKNFILQETVSLKGISHVGPVYEFKERPVMRGMSTAHPFPLLGKDAILHEFVDLLMEFTRAHPTLRRTSLVAKHYNGIVISGDMRQGKTRLLDEMVYFTPKNVSVNQFTLSHKDSKVPYRTLFLIFSSPLGLNDGSSLKEREEKLNRSLEKLRAPDYICAFNKIFRTNYQTSTVYMALNDEEKQTVLEKMMMHLCNVVFMTKWLIAIDDAVFIDDETWTFFNILLDTEMLFIILTMGTQRQLSVQVQEHLEDDRIKKIDLLPVEKWFQCGLACQILEVYAIPPELEKVIQARSNGNPGWIESFLVSLIQDGALHIKHRTVREISESGLVSPPLTMMMRLPQHVLKDIRQTPMFVDMDENQGVFDVSKLSDRESVRQLIIHSLKERTSQFGTKYPVCILDPNFNLEEVDAELSMDVMIIKTFDSLTSYEQLLLKCSSVLGEDFQRTMLLYVMSTAKPRATALAIQKLFEIRVLGCAQGDFTHGDGTIVFKRFVDNPDKDIGIKCKCVGILVDKECRDLPKFASCGYIRFRSPTFRTTTYDLLTDNQKKAFHNRAIQYLEKVTRRCRSCGNGFFVKILGVRNDDVSFFLNQSPKYVEWPLKVSIADVKWDDFSAQLFFPEKFSKYSLGMSMIHNLKNSFSLTRTFSYADFTSCQCIQILNMIYTQMIEHCNGANRYDILMDSLLEYAYLCITSCNVPEALKLLEDATRLVDIMEEHLTENHYAEELAWKIPIIRGKIDCLKGQARYELGEVQQAYSCFLNSLHHYGYRFPSNIIMLKMDEISLRIKHWLSLYLFPGWFIGKVDGYRADFCDNVAECLSLLCNLFKEIQLWEHAQFAALWSLNRSLRSYINFHGICTSYANMIEVAHHLGKHKMAIALEVHALRFCHQKRSPIEAEELRTVSKLYAAIFIARLLRAEMEKAIHIGTIVIGICSSVHAVPVCVRILPFLAQTLLMQNQISEASSLITQLSYYAAEDSDNTGKTWYYTMCITFHLETGYTIERYSNCERFYQTEASTFVNLRDKDAEKRFYVVMWLWTIRNGLWEPARMWYLKAFTHMNLEDDSLGNVLTMIYLLEGLLLFTVGKMNKRDLKSTAEAHDQIKELSRYMDQIAKTTKIILPRLLHLKAYQKLIKNHESEAMKLLQRGLNVAEKRGNELEVEWISHSFKAWKNNLPSIQVDFWRDHCEPAYILDYHELEFQGKLGLFTLPVPRYY